MSYLALARKWRPRTFSQLIGQEHVSRALVNALNQNRLHHAYLFTGTRGVGKTSVARILAKALNCERGISSDPCLICDACLAIEQGRFIDLLEIDGASKTRVEDTRELLDNVQYAPATGRFKIYLIDEVHMLSQHSFNALLKTLEEPPEHVKFILATTDPQKLPVTVLSRCLQFNLKHVSPELISNHLQFILKEEHLDFETAAIDILAKAAKGSMRDALSLLDQAITGCEKLQANDVKMILGYTQHDYALKLLGGLAKQDASLLLSLSQQIAIEGGQFQYVLDEILNYLHQMTIYHSIGGLHPLINPSSEVILLADQFSAEDIQLFYQIGLKGREEIHFAPTLTIGFNMTMLRMLTFRPAPRAAIPQQAIQQNNIKISSHIAENINSNMVIKEQPEQPVEKNPALSIRPLQELAPENELREETGHRFGPYAKSHEDSSTVSLRQDTAAVEFPKKSIESKDWSNIVLQLKLTGLALTAIENAEFISRDGREIILGVTKGHLSLFTPTIQNRIEAALGNYCQEPVKIILKSDATVHASPAQQKEQATQLKQQKAEEALQQDPIFQQLQQKFSAELVKNSIAPLKDDL